MEKLQKLSIYGLAAIIVLSLAACASLPPKPSDPAKAQKYDQIVAKMKGNSKTFDGSSFSRGQFELKATANYLVNYKKLEFGQEDLFPVMNESFWKKSFHKITKFAEQHRDDIDSVNPFKDNDHLKGLLVFNKFNNLENFTVPFFNDFWQHIGDDYNYVRVQVGSSNLYYNPYDDGGEMRIQICISNWFFEQWLGNGSFTEPGKYSHYFLFDKDAHLLKQSKNPFYRRSDKDKIKDAFMALK
jgi:hypothetical protein